MGSAIDGKRRWSKHKSDIRKENWDNCGLTRHFEQQHKGDMEEAITLVDHLVGVFTKEKLLQLEKEFI